MTIELPKSTEIIVFTGPESSGKTTTAQRISNLYSLPLVEEYARTYLNQFGQEYTFDDLKNITAGQLSDEKESHRDHSFIICDTDLVTLEIWALEKFERSLNQKDELFGKKHYFLCYPDIPWEPDPLRENPHDRFRLFDRYKSYLQELNASFTVLKEEDRVKLNLKL